MDPVEYLSRLDSALQSYRYDDLCPLTDQADPSLFTNQQMKKALGMLRRRRRFGDLERLAALFIVSGKSEPNLRRQLAQALLDQNRVQQGLRVLCDMAPKVQADPVEGPEVRGLIGRAYKQLYVNQGGHENLRRAIDSYKEDWGAKRGDYRWQGINVAALTARGSRDGIDLHPTETVQHIASTLLDDIEDKGVSGAWDYATAIEASVALGDQASALKWARGYLQHPGADAFEIASTLRQLKEVWQLEQTPLGNTLLPVLEYALLQREGGALEPAKLAGTIQKAGFEAVWGDESVVYLQWIDTLYARCNAIARINDAATGAPKGTGFLVPGSTLRPNWGDTPVLVTNSHVVSDNIADEAPLRPGEAAAEFTRLPGRPRVVLGKMLYTSPKVHLDVSIFELTPPNGCCALTPHADPPVIDETDTVKPRVYVIGHPAGRELAVSLYDNSVEEYEGCYVRYRSPTEGGNSGSPVFDRQLRSFAVHHRAHEEKKLNEGVLLKHIQAATAQ